MRILMLLLVMQLPAAWGQDILHFYVNPAASPGTIQRNVRILPDIPYVPNALPRQRLDLYLPAQTGAPRPLVAYIHGGGWRGGTKSNCPAPGLVPLGYAVASIEYRFSQDAPYPAQIEDCKAAIRWLRAHSSEYGIDPSRIGVWGASAGGHLVALLGVTGHIRDFDSGPNLDPSSAVQCVVDFFGPTDFLKYGNPPSGGHDAPDSLVAQLLGGPIATHQAQARSASPVYFVTGDAAPFLIIHGDRDPIVPLQQSQEFQDALQRAGVECALHVVAGSGHGGPGFNTAEDRDLVVKFLNRHLKPGNQGKADQLFSPKE